MGNIEKILIDVQPKIDLIKNIFSSSSIDEELKKAMIKDSKNLPSIDDFETWINPYHIMFNLKKKETYHEVTWYCPNVIKFIMNKYKSIYKDSPLKNEYLKMEDYDSISFIIRENVTRIYWGRLIEFYISKSNGEKRLLDPHSDVFYKNRNRMITWDSAFENKISLNNGKNKLISLLSHFSKNPNILETMIKIDTEVSYDYCNLPTNEFESKRCKLYEKSTIYDIFKYI